jgi:hypothetical protein
MLFYFDVNLQITINKSKKFKIIFNQNNEIQIILAKKKKFKIILNQKNVISSVMKTKNEKSCLTKIKICKSSVTKTKNSKLCLVKTKNSESCSTKIRNSKSCSIKKREFQYQLKTSFSCFFAEFQKKINLNFCRKSKIEQNSRPILKVVKFSFYNSVVLLVSFEKTMKTCIFTKLSKVNFTFEQEFI